MNQIEVLRMSSDVILFCALCFLGFRVLRRPSILPQLSKLTELESGIRQLLRQAEDASSALNEELLKRRRELERTLNEAEELERSLKRTMQEPSRPVISPLPIETIIEDEPVAKKPVRAPFIPPKETPRPSPTAGMSAYEASLKSAPTQVARVPKYQPTELELAAEPPSFEEIAKQREAAPPIKRATPLSQTVERTSDYEMEETLEELFARADQALKVGRELAQAPMPAQITPATNLESPIIENLENVHREDPRLGVLAVTQKRHSQLA